MSALGKDISGHLVELANRLRLLQVDLADQSPQARRGYLKEEIGRTLASIMPEQHNAFLLALLERFPVWGPAAPEAPSPRQEDAQPPVPAQQAPDPHTLIERLVGLAKSATPDDRKAIRDHMIRVGLIPQASAREPERPRARPPAEGEILSDAARCADLVSALVDHLGALDAVVWKVWNEIAPQAHLRRPAELRQELARYVSGEGGVSRKAILDHADLLRRLTLSLLAAVRATGRRCATQHLAKFAPGEIQETVGKAGFLENQDAKCWRKYVELAEELEPVFMERKIMATLALLTEELMTQSR